MTESKYLKQSDVPEEKLVTVKKLTKVNVARDDETPEYRWTVQFEELPKPMVLNVTNIKRMGKALGDDTDDWTGKQIVVYVDPDIEYAGQIVGGLRVRASRAKHIKQPTMDDINRDMSKASDDDIPF